MNKLKTRAGESLVELLLSMLIISLGMLMLAGAITTTARLNATAREMSTGTNSGDSNNGGNPTPANEQVQVEVKQGDSSYSLGTYKLENNMGLYFYG